jgi:hypothetical protein
MPRSNAQRRAVAGCALGAMLLSGCQSSAPQAISSRPAVSPHATPSPAPAISRPAVVSGDDGITVTRFPAAKGGWEAARMVVDQRLVMIRWHPGTVVPGGTGWSAPDTLTARERATVLATFNAGFTNTGSRGGTREGNRVHGRLRPGAATLLIDRTGRANVRAYDPVRDASVPVARQNLDLLVDGGRPAPTVGQDDSRVWGNTLHHRHATYRSGVGITARGFLVVIVADRVTTAQLATLLVQAGAVRAMELDINPQFVCLLTYTHVGGRVTPHRVLPRQQGSLYRYLGPSRRDFFSVGPR